MQFLPRQDGRDGNLLGDRPQDRRLTPQFQIIRIIVLRVGDVRIPRPREGADEMDPRVGWDTEASKEL